MVLEVMAAAVTGICRTADLLITVAFSPLLAAAALVDRLIAKMTEV